MCSLTCTEVYKHVHKVDDITEIVEGEPENQVALLQLPEHGSGHDHDQVVEHGR